MGNHSSSDNPDPTHTSSYSPNCARHHWVLYTHSGHHTINFIHNTSTTHRLLIHNGNTLVNRKSPEKTIVYTFLLPNNPDCKAQLLNEPQPDLGRVVTFDTAGNEISPPFSDVSQTHVSFNKQSFIHTHAHSKPTKCSVIIRYIDFRYIYGLKINGQSYYGFINDFYTQR